MGVTIHYRGRLNDPADLRPLCDELREIARAIDWEFHRLRDGAILGPHVDCEPLVFQFRDDGTMHGLFDEPWSFCKTQFAPVEIHIAIVRLLRHLERRYFAELEVRDEGGYWESRDRERLIHHRQQVGAALEAFADPPSSPVASLDDLLDRIDRALDSPRP